MKISWIKSGDIRESVCCINISVNFAHCEIVHDFCLLILLIIKKNRNYQTSMSNSLDPYISQSLSVPDLGPN